MTDKAKQLFKKTIRKLADITVTDNEGNERVDSVYLVTEKEKKGGGKHEQN